MNAHQRRVARRRYDQHWAPAVTRAADRYGNTLAGTLAALSIEPSTSGRGLHIFTRAPTTFRVTRADGCEVAARPPDAPCPCCGKLMPAMMAAS